MNEQDKAKRVDSEIDFETGLKRLQDIVERLEKQDLPLEEAVKLFEEGMKLSNTCAEILEHAEKRVKVLIKEQESGSVIEKDLEELDQEITS